VLGATVLREPIAYAATATPFQSVIVMNSDAQPIPVKQMGGVTASTSDVDQRTAVRFGQKIFFTSSGDDVVLIPKDAIAADKKFIVTYVNVFADSSIGGQDLADGYCTMALLTTLGGGTSSRRF